MKMENNDELNDELREEYDFSQMVGGVRGKYAEQYHEGVKLIWCKQLKKRQLISQHHKCN
ncbi:MAG: hypothetical protein ABFS56_18855 [Pseudomonadota bacterium]